MWASRAAPPQPRSLPQTHTNTPTHQHKPAPCAGRYMWEVDRVRSEWAAQMAEEVDEVWVPSQWHAASAKQHGVPESKVRKGPAATLILRSASARASRLGVCCVPATPAPQPLARKSRHTTPCFKLTRRHADLQLVSSGGSPCKRESPCVQADLRGSACLQITVMPLSLDASLLDPAIADPVALPFRRRIALLSVFKLEDRKGWRVLLPAFLKARGTRPRCWWGPGRASGRLRPAVVCRRVRSLVTSAPYAPTSAPISLSLPAQAFRNTTDVTLYLHCVTYPSAPRPSRRRPSPRAFLSR